MIQKYDDGKIVKTAEELQKADNRALKEMPIVKFYDQHSKGKEDERIVGFALPPIGMPSFNKGKIKRDIFYDKGVITQQELQELRTAPHSSKKDVSIGFIDNTQYQKGLWNGQSVDGYSKDMALDHLAWVEHGRCSTNDGCGLVRSDKQQFRMDAITIVNDNKGDSNMDNDNKEDCKERTDEEKVFLEEAQKAIILTLEEHAAAEKARYKADSAELSQKLDSILELLKVDKFPPKEKEKDPDKEKEKKEKEKDEFPDKEEKEKKKKDSVTEDSIIEELKARIDSIEKENKELQKPREDVRYTYSLDEMIAKEETEKNKENE